MIDYYLKLLHLNDEEEQLMQKWLSLPPEAIPYLLKMLDDCDEDSFEEAEKVLLTMAQKRHKE